MEEIRTKLQPTVTGRKPVKSVTLTPGLWTYVCPCGFRAGTVRIRKTEAKWMVWCFACKTSNGKYVRIMNEERIDFTSNPNGKLNCNYFLLLRLAHPIKHAVGLTKQIWLKGIFKGNARILTVDQCLIDRIPPLISYLAAGLSPEQLRRTIRESYRKRPTIDWRTQLLDVILMEYIHETKEPELFK